MKKDFDFGSVWELRIYAKNITYCVNYLAESLKFLPCPFPTLLSYILPLLFLEMNLKFWIGSVIGVTRKLVKQVKQIYSK